MAKSKDTEPYTVIKEGKNGRSNMLVSGSQNADVLKSMIERKLSDGENVRIERGDHRGER